MDIKKVLLVFLILVTIIASGCTQEKEGGIKWSEEEKYPETYSYEKITVHYQESSESTEAKKLAEYWWSQNQKSTDLYLKADDGRYIVGWTTVYSSQSEIPKKYDSGFQGMATELSRQAFESKTVILRVLNSQGEVLKKYLSG